MQHYADTISSMMVMRMMRMKMMSNRNQINFTPVALQPQVGSWARHSHQRERGDELGARDINQQQFALHDWLSANAPIACCIGDGTFRNHAQKHSSGICFCQIWCSSAAIIRICIEKLNNFSIPRLEPTYWQAVELSLRQYVLQSVTITNTSL